MICENKRSSQPQQREKERVFMIRGTAKKGLKRIAAGCIAAVYVIGCTQGSIVTARAEDEESEMEAIKEDIKRDAQDNDWPDAPRGSSDLQTYIMCNNDMVEYDGIRGCKVNYDPNTPGDYYDPETSTLVHVDENKLVTVYVSDGVNKWPVEYTSEDDEGNQIGWTTDGVNITIVKHPNVDKYKAKDKFETEYGLSVDPVPDTPPAPPISEKLSASEDPGTMEYGIKRPTSGIVIGRNTTHITGDDFDDFWEFSTLVIRSTKIEKISKNMCPDYSDYGLGFANRNRTLKIYLPKEKFSKYKSMLLKVKSFKISKLKFYTLDKWNGKMSYVLMPDRGTSNIAGGENYDDVTEQERVEALKGTSIKKGTKEYEYVLKNGETPDRINQL